MISCKKCGNNSYTAKDQIDSIGRTHVRLDCSVCKSFIMFMPTQSAQEFKMPFGKHKGVPLKDVPRSYLQWLLRECDLKENMREKVEEVLDTPLDEGTDFDHHL